MNYEMKRVQEPTENETKPNETYWVKSFLFVRNKLAFALNFFVCARRPPIRPSFAKG